MYLTGSDGQLDLLDELFGDPAGVDRANSVSAPTTVPV